MIRIKHQPGMITIEAGESTAQVSEIEPGLCTVNIFTSALEHSTSITVSIFEIVKDMIRNRDNSEPDRFIMNYFGFQAGAAC